MPRRFAVLLVGILLSLLVALLLARTLLTGDGETGAPRTPTVVPTPMVPPTPIPPRRLVLWFSSVADDKLHPEARDVPASADEIALLRAVAGAVLEGPRKERLLRPFPEGWTLRAAFRLPNGTAVVDLALPRPRPRGTPLSLAPAERTRWETGSSEELAAAQALVISVVRNLPVVTRVVLLLDGEPAETLAGHVDLTHPLLPDGSSTADEEPGEPPEPTPTPTVGPTPAASPTPPPEKLQRRPTPRQSPVDEGTA